MVAESNNEIPVLKPGLDLARPGEAQPEADENSRRLYLETLPKTVQILTDKGVGSGVFLDEEGRLTTAAHVILGSREQNAVTSDGVVYKLKIEKLDDINDTAILKPIGYERGSYPHAEFAQSSKIEPDQPIYAMGHPQGLRPAYVSPGYFQRQVSMQDMLKEQAPQVEAQIENGMERLTPREQKYAREGLAREILGGKIHIRPGDSGGPLFNADGKLLGQNDLITSFESGYFVPMEKIRDLYNSKESQFEFKYDRLAAPWVQEYKNTWMQKPTLALTETAGAGLAAYGVLNLASRFPRFLGPAAAAAGGVRLLGDGSSLLSATDGRDQLKYGLASAADLTGMIGGLATMTSRYRAAGLVGLGLGLAGRMAVDFIPNRLVLSDLTRKSDYLMPPADPQIDRTLRLGGMESANGK